MYRSDTKKIRSQNKKAMLLGSCVHSVGGWVGSLQSSSAPLQKEDALKQVVKSLEVGGVSRMNNRPPDQM